MLVRESSGGAIGNVCGVHVQFPDIDFLRVADRWLAVILTFLLARVLAEGTHMREDLDGTV
jgi:hypothetical protein